MHTVPWIVLSSIDHLTIFIKYFLLKNGHRYGLFCNFALDSVLPKWKTFFEKKTEKLSKTENFLNKRSLQVCLSDSMNNH